MEPSSGWGLYWNQQGHLLVCWHGVQECSCCLAGPQEGGLLEWWLGLAVGLCGAQGRVKLGMVLGYCVLREGC